MNTNLMLRNGRYFKNKFWEKQTKFMTPPMVMHHIQIPPRIERGPVDILKALSTTIKTEPVCEEYKYQYGGIFNISSVYKKRIVSLSFDSGKKAAKWIVASNPKLFQHKVSEPYIKAFSPPQQFDENSEVSEEILLGLIQDIKVTSAIKVYELLKGKGIDVSNSTKQQLLELVCFYNCIDKPDEMLLETKYFENQKTTTSNTWNAEGFAMKLFSEMERNIESYSAVILGMFKYNNASGAIALYEEAEDVGIKFDVNVYNSLLENTISETFHYSDQSEIILKILNKMENENIEPNLETLNSALKSVCWIRKWHKSREFAWSLYNEFTRIGIKPSLGTYYYLLEIFLDRSNVNGILTFILNELERDELVLQHIDDFKFFSKAMEKCAYNFKSVPLAHKINNLLSYGNNRDFLCSQYHESIYYRCYLRTLFESGNLDLALDTYCQLVPASFSPDIGTLLIILEQIKIRKGIQCLPRLWSDIKKMSTADSEKILNLLVTVIDTAGSETTKETDLEIAKEAWQNIEKGEMRTRWDSDVASAFLRIFSRCNDKEMSYKAFDFAQFLKGSYVLLDFDSVSIFMKFCISLGDKEKALECIEYVAKGEDANIEKMVKQFASRFALEEEDLIHMRKYMKNSNGNQGE